MLSTTWCTEGSHCCTAVVLTGGEEKGDGRSGGGCTCQVSQRPGPVLPPDSVLSHWSSPQPYTVGAALSIPQSRKPRLRLRKELTRSPYSGRQKVDSNRIIPFLEDPTVSAALRDSVYKLHGATSGPRTVSCRRNPHVGKVSVSA